MSKLELAILAGAESKAFLAGLTTQIDRLEKLTKKLNVSKVNGSDEDDVDDATEEEAEEVETKSKRALKKAKAAQEDEESDDNSEDGYETDSEESEDSEASDEGSDEDEAPVRKSAKTKITKEMIKDACRAYMAETSRHEVERILEKKFGTKKVNELDPADYPKVLKALEL